MLRNQHNDRDPAMSGSKYDRASARPKVLRKQHNGKSLSLP
jgi:hypothetical protein